MPRHCVRLGGSARTNFAEGEFISRSPRPGERLTELVRELAAKDGVTVTLPKHSAVNVQGLASFDQRKLTRRMGTLSSTKMDEAKTALRELLEL